MKGCCQVPALVLLHHHGTVITDVFMGSSGSDFHMHALRKLLNSIMLIPPVLLLRICWMSFGLTLHITLTCS
jgi:hypothetical protein